MKREFTTKIIRQDYPSTSYGESEGKEYKFKGGIIGQEVRVKRTRGKKGKLMEVLTPSHLEGESKCPHYKECGGCTYQTMSIEAENKYKKDLVEELFKAHGITKDFEFLESPHHTGYRNKMEYTFGDEYKGSPIALGLHKKNRFYEIVNTKECNIVHEDFNIIRREVRKYFDDRGLTHYNRRAHTGDLRHLMIRRGFNTGEIMINLVTTWQVEVPEDFVAFLLSLPLEGEIKTIIHTANDSWSDAIVPEKVTTLYGEGYITDRIFDNTFIITPFSFFQTNTESAEKLFKTALSMVDVKDKTVYDLYCGAGTIGMSIAHRAKKVVGCEIVEEAVESARKNAELNNITNIEFHAMDVGEFLEERGADMDLVIVDPPREGLMKKAVANLVKYAPKEILYISCNPVTLTENIKDFEEQGYKLKTLKALNQFPRTTHVECIALIQRVKS